jgi:hypothetical protein
LINPENAIVKPAGVMIYFNTWHDWNTHMYRIFTPVVSSGHGKGRQFIQELVKSDLPPYLFEGNIFPGTLALRFGTPINLNQDIAMRFQGVEYYPARLEGMEVLVKWTIKHPAVVQVISKHNLRNHFSLLDGTRVHLTFDDNYLIPNSIETIRNYFIGRLSQTIIGNVFRKAKYYFRLATNNQF